MTKIMISDHSSVELTYYSLERLSQELPDLIEQYGKNAYLEAISVYDEPYIAIMYEREETDQEYNKRMNFDSRARERERAEYERLKAKFGDAS